MSNAGYGNHDSSLPGSASGGPALVKPAGDATARASHESAGSTDAEARQAVEGASSGPLSSSNAADPKAGSPSTTSDGGSRQAAAAGGDGASSAGHQGGEVDPGVG